MKFFLASSLTLPTQSPLMEYSLAGFITQDLRALMLLTAYIAQSAINLKKQIKVKTLCNMIPDAHELTQPRKQPGAEIS